MTRDDAPLAGDLLLQAVEGTARPLFVLDEGWRFRYVDPAGARVLARTVEELVGRDIWAEFPEAVGGPFQLTYERMRHTGEPGSTEAWFAPLGRWFRADAFLTGAGVPAGGPTAHRRAAARTSSLIAATPSGAQTTE